MMHYNEIINKHLGLAETHWVDKGFEDMIRLRDLAIITYTRRKDFFTELMESGYLDENPNFTIWTHKVGENKVFLEWGALTIHTGDIDTNQVLSNLGVAFLNLIIGDSDAYIKLMSCEGSDVMTIPFIKDNKIVNLSESGIIRDIKRITICKGVSKELNDWIKKSVAKFEEILIGLNGNFDLYMAEVLNKYHGEIKKELNNKLS